MLEKLFKLNKRNTDIKTELLAGLTIFITMSYVMVAIPTILSNIGLDAGAIFTANILALVIATVFIAFFSNLPIVLAPSISINIFMFVVIVKLLGYSWQFALTAAIIQSVLFTLLVCLNLREVLINVIPKNLIYAITCGLGFYMVFFVLTNMNSTSLSVNIADLNQCTIQYFLYDKIGSFPIILCLIGVVIGAYLMEKKIKGSIIITVIIATFIGIPMGLTRLPTDFTMFQMPPSIRPIVCDFQLDGIISKDMIVVVSSLLFLNVFNVVGVLVGVTSKAGLLKRDDEHDKIRYALLSCSVGSIISSFIGVGSVTPYTESASGVMEGGRTGLTALTAAALFALSLFFYPIIAIIPKPVIIAAIVLTGIYMIKSIQYINFKDHTEAVPSLLLIIIMPLVFSISEGIIVGILSYVILKILMGKARQLDPVLILLALLFCISLAFFGLNLNIIV